MERFSHNRISASIVSDLSPKLTSRPLKTRTLISLFLLIAVTSPIRLTAPGFFFWGALGHVTMNFPGSRPILSYGPWCQGRYDSVSVGLSKRLSKRFTLETLYTWVHAVDNALNSSFVSEVQTSRGAGSLGSFGPTDSFIGVPSLVTDPMSGKTNASGSFIASNGNPVPQAGKFYNGANLDRGPSDLALNHTLLVHGAVSLPWQMQVSGIFRAQSGFHFSVSSLTPVDVDGDGLLNGEALREPNIQVDVSTRDEAIASGD